MAIVEMRHLIKPPPGQVKCNIGEALNMQTYMVAFGAVVRDSQGLFQGAVHVPILFNSDSVTMEALTCREALQ